MAIKRFTANADNTITNAFKSDLVTRATASNMGKSDILEVFSIYAQSTSVSQEAARILINFDIAGIASARSSGEIPAPGSVNFYLRMFNAEHSSTLPENFNLVVAPVSSSWSEGTGLDMDEYQDEAVSNWINRQSSTAWTVQGGDFLTGSSDFTVEQTFTNGYEDLLVDVTQQVEEWVNDNTGSYGFGVFLTSSLESDTNSYYTKKFHARRSEYFLKRPVLEARWDSSRQDDSSKFYLRTGKLTNAQAKNTLYFYNVIDGELANINGDPSTIYLSLYSASGPAGNRLALPIGFGVSVAGDTEITGSKISTGIYSASLMFDSSSISTVYPLWHNNSSIEYHTGSAITVRSRPGGNIYDVPEYVAKITNLRSVYRNTEEATFRVYTRKKNWQPTIYTVAQNCAPLDIIPKFYWSITRIEDGEEVIPYGTGSVEFTKLSYDASGSYFDLDMSMLEPDYAYEISFIYRQASTYHAVKDRFKFRVEE